MRRKIGSIAGYDCREHCTDPRHMDTYGKPYPRPGASHGRSGDIWCYSVHTDDGECVVELQVDVNQGSTISPIALPPRERQLILHTSWPQTEDEIRAGAPGIDCTYVRGGKCYSSSRSMMTFFRQHGRPQVNQLEPFWAALEALAAEWIAKARAEAPGNRVARCPHCNGTGLVGVTP